ncbi:occludin/ELL domain-containing protein 1 [Echinops telfairi]|uniref:Occludin/ELL domain-containing protein 1 n=1 Tax=Echinops telfairi TaxID=9371 RepID=A0ABM0IDW0_ECHTE|nr:occludin/ELL domain-containing protein 1 [Echinops telfairi]
MVRPAPFCPATSAVECNLRLKLNRSGRTFSSGAPDPGLGARTLGQAARRPPPPCAGRDATRRSRPPPRGPPNGAVPRSMPIRETPQTHGSQRDPQLRPPGPGPPCLRRHDPRALEASSPRSLCQPQSGAHRARPKKIVFEDELPPQAFLETRRPLGATPGVYKPSPHPLPDYELKYPSVSSERERSRYVAVFQDQYSEFVELQQEVASAQAELHHLQTQLNSLPPPRSQKEAQVTARVWRKFEKKQMDPRFLDKQARYRYLKGKLRHLKAQIQKYDEQDSEGSVYF